MKAGYRADIDGLRAVAVLSVILFHLELAGFSGGYVGVDVFFVISGFLITRIIRDDVLAGTFTFANFYERRARRIFPSLIAVLLLSTAGAGLIFSIEDMAGFGKALMSTLLFVSNIYFWQEIGYFTADVHVKPLLHMWSLSVEEQFYVFWPLLLLFLLRKTNTRVTIIAMVVLSAISLLICEMFIQEDANGVFYLLPFRVFEFFIGAGMVWLVERQIKWRIVREVLFIGGLGAIVYAVATFSTQTPFPSVYALIPTVGAGLIIYAGAQTYGRYLLSNPVMAFTGRISYELYLVHWPLYVYFHYWSLKGIDDTHKMIIGSLTFVISVIIYYAVGRPLRRVKDHHAMLNFYIGCAVSATVLALICFSVLRVDYGWKWRIDEKYRTLATDMNQFHRSQYGGANFSTDMVIELGKPTAQPSFILFGDSYAAQYAYGLTKLLNAENRKALALFDHACMVTPLVTTYIRGNPDPTCNSEYPKVQQMMLGNKLPVIMAHSWHTYKQMLGTKDGQLLTFPDDLSYYSKLIETVEAVREQVGEDRRFIVVGLVPGASNQKTISRCFVTPKFIPNDCASEMAVNRADATMGIMFNAMLKEYGAKHPNVTIIDPYDAFCDEKSCRVIDERRIYYSDGNHLSVDGSDFFAEHYKNFFLNIDQPVPAVATPAPAAGVPSVVPAAAEIPAAPAPAPAPVVPAESTAPVVAVPPTPAAPVAPATP